VLVKIRGSDLALFKIYVGGGGGDTALQECTKGRRPRKYGQSVAWGASSRKQT